MSRPLSAVAAHLREIIPQGLIAGLGVPRPGVMCIEAAKCFALGERHGDRPSCDAAPDREFAIRINGDPAGEHAMSPNFYRLTKHKEPRGSCWTWTLDVRIERARALLTGEADTEAEARAAVADFCARLGVDVLDQRDRTPSPSRVAAVVGAAPASDRTARIVGERPEGWGL